MTWEFKSLRSPRPIEASWSTSTEESKAFKFLQSYRGCRCSYLKRMSEAKEVQGMIHFYMQRAGSHCPSGDVKSISEHYNLIPGGCTCIVAEKVTPPGICRSAIADTSIVDETKQCHEPSLLARDMTANTSMCKHTLDPNFCN